MKYHIIVFSIVIVAVVGFALAGRSKIDSANTAQAQIPIATGYVNDYANMIGPVAEMTLENDLKSFSSQIAVLTVDSMNGLTIEEFGIKVADAWKVGNKDKDDGVILIVSKGDRKVRIEVGHGAEAKINDAKAGRILDNDVIPRFKESDFEGGIIAGVQAIKNLMK